MKYRLARRARQDVLDIWRYIAANTASWLLILHKAIQNILRNVKVRLAQTIKGASEVEQPLLCCGAQERPRCP